MIGVDLIPESSKLSRHRQRRLRFWIVVVSLVGLMSVCLAGLKYFVYIEEDGRIDLLTEQLDSIQSEISVLSVEKNELDRYQDRIALLYEMKRYPDYARVISSLGSHCPDTVYFHKMKFGRPDALKGVTKPVSPLPRAADMFKLKAGSVESEPVSDGGSFYQISLSVNATAVDHRSVSDFLDMLRDSDFFTAVHLERTVREPSGVFRAVDFEAEAVLKPSVLPSGFNYADTQKPQNF